MVTWWRESNVPALEGLLSNGSDYTDQIVWTSISYLLNDTAAGLGGGGGGGGFGGAEEDEDPVGLVPIDHANFSEIIRSVLRRDPDTTFRYIGDDFWTSAPLTGIGSDVPGLDPTEASSAWDGSCPGTNGATREQLQVVRQVGFYLDQIAQSAVGACGACANAFACFVLLDSRRLRVSGFNCLLAGLLAVYTLYIADSLALEVYKSSFRGWAPFDYAFSRFLFPVRPALLYASTWVTVLMARERHAAIRHPIAYRNASLSATRPWARALAQISLCLLAAMLFVVPLFFESEVRWFPVRTVQTFNETHKIETIGQRHELQITEFRTRRSYVFWYKHAATYGLTVLLPVIALAGWNAHTISLMRRRRQASVAAGRRLGGTSAAGGSAATVGINNANAVGGSQPVSQNDNNNNRNCDGGSTTAQQQATKAEETTARMLLVLTVLFFCCNSLRVVVVTEELVANRDYLSAQEQGCVAMPFWVLVLNRTSLFLLTVNASCASLVYCAMSSDFRRALVVRLRRIAAALGVIRCVRAVTGSAGAIMDEGPPSSILDSGRPNRRRLSDARGNLSVPPQLGGRGGAPRCNAPSASDVVVNIEEEEEENGGAESPPPKIASDEDLRKKDSKVSRKRTRLPRSALVPSHSLPWMAKLSTDGVVRCKLSPKRAAESAVSSSEEKAPPSPGSKELAKPPGVSSHQFLQVGGGNLDRAVYFTRRHSASVRRALFST